MIFMYDRNLLNVWKFNNFEFKWILVFYFLFVIFFSENLFVNLFICKYGWLFFGGVGDIVIDVISGVVRGEEIFDV